MPRNGSGIYGPPAGTSAIPNTPIESAKYNAFVADAAEALTASINVNGTAPFQSNQPMGGFRHTNLGAGTAAGDSVNLGQAQSGIAAHATTTGGTPDAITASFSPAFTAYTAKTRFRFTASAANTIANPTINVDGLGIRTVKKLNGVALGIGDIAGPGHVCDCLYDGADVLLLNPALASSGGQNVFTARQTFNGPVVHGKTTLTDAATIVWDLSTGGPDYEVTITSNRILGAFTGATAGQEGLLTVKQDGTGGWSLNLGNTVYDFWGPSIENIARGPNEETVYAYKVISAGAMILRRLGATSIGRFGRDLLDVKTANNSATIDFVLTKWLQLYDRFEVDLDDILPATDSVELWMRTSTNGGSSYDAGASDYSTVWDRKSNGALDGAIETGAQIVLVPGNAEIDLSNAASETAAGTVIVFNPRATGRCKIASKITFIPSNISNVIAQYDGIASRNTAADVDAVRFLCSSGNIVSGKFRLYGIGG